MLLAGLVMTHSMLTFDPSDQFFERVLIVMQVALGFVVVMSLLGIPFSGLVLRVVTLVALSATVYVVATQFHKGMPGFRLSVPGGVII